MDLISKLGYSRFSPYQNSPFLDIKSPNGLIDMSNTDMPLLGIGLQTGVTKFLRPGTGLHSFPGDKVIREIKLPKAQKGVKVFLNEEPLNPKKWGDYNIVNPKNPNQRYPVYKRDVKQIVATAIGMGYDPKTAMAVALQETGAGKSDPNYFHVLHGPKLEKKYWELPDDEAGIQMLKDKKAYANKLGYTTPELELQAFNGLGKIFPETEKDYHGFEMKKAYGVPIPREGIDMKKNPLYGKRILDIKDSIVENEPFINQTIDEYKKFYDDPDSVYFTRASILPEIEIVAKRTKLPDWNYANEWLENYPEATSGKFWLGAGALEQKKKGGQTTLDKFYKNLFQNINKRVDQDEDVSFGKRALGAIETVVEDPLNALNFLFTKKQKLSNPWENPYGVDFISDRQGNVKKTWAPKYGAVDNSTTTETTRPPIYTDDKKKVQAYQDSLNLYNYSILQAKNYFKEPNPNKYSDYNKKEAIDRMRIDKGLYGSLSNSMDDKYGSKITNLQKRTGYLPIGQRYIGEGSNYIFKKPVQPYILQEQPQLKMVGHEIDRSSSFRIPNIVAKSPTLLQQKQGDYVLRFQEYDEEGNPINREVFSNDRKQLDDMMNFLSQQGRKYANISTQGNYNSVPYKKGGVTGCPEGQVRLPNGQCGTLEDLKRVSNEMVWNNNIPQEITDIKELPEIVIYPMDKETKKFREGLEPKHQYAFDQFVKEYGTVNITRNKGKGIFSGTSGYYNPLTNTINIKPNRFENTVWDAYNDTWKTYLAELAHKKQFKEGAISTGLNWLSSDLPSYAKSKYQELKNRITDNWDEPIESPYSTPGTVEYEAHSIIEPDLMKVDRKLRENYYDYIYDRGINPPEEKSPFKKKKQFGGIYRRGGSVYNPTNRGLIFLRPRNGARFTYRHKINNNANFVYSQWIQ